MEQVHALEPAIVLLLVGILAVVLTRPLRLSPIVGYLIAGMLIGPHGLALVAESETTHLLAELGVVFLLFDIGLHFSLRHIWDARRDILGFGPLQMLACTAAFGAIAMLAGFDLSLAIVIGATLALSSTAVVMQTLAAKDRNGCPIGLTATAILIFQDICAIFLLILATSLEGADVSLGSAVGLAALKAAAAFAAAILIGRYLIGPLFRLISATRNEEVFTAMALLIVLLTAAATGLLGLSLTLGAFLAGMIISETPYRHVIQTEVKPFRGLLLGFFFITIGATLDIDVLLRDWGLILAAVVLLLSVKTVVIFAAALAVRTPLPSAVGLGFLLSQGSEFAFVIFGMPALREALGSDLSAVLIAAVAASMALTPSVAAIGHRLAMRLSDREYAAQQSEAAAEARQPAPVVIVGMGEIGRRVADGLEAHGIGYTALDMDHDRFISANADGYAVSFGDAGDPRLMATIELEQRPTVVVTINRYEVSKAVTPVIRERYPHLTRFIAVDDDDEKPKFEDLGMQPVVTRSIPAGLDLAAVVLRHHGLSDERVADWMRDVQMQSLTVITNKAA